MVMHIALFFASVGLIALSKLVLSHWTDEHVVEAVRAVHAIMLDNQITVEATVVMGLVLMTHALKRMYKHYRSGSNALALGMIYGSLNNQTADMEYSKASLEVLAKDATTIRIWGATGWDTFGAANSPLHKAVQSCSGSVKIVLAFPESPKIAERVLNLQSAGNSTSVERYKKEIYNSLRVAQSLKQRGMPIKVKLYRGYPTWKMVLLDKIAWLQQYPPHKNVEDSPCSVYEKKPGGTLCVYDNINCHFERYWNSVRGGVLNLTDLTIEFHDAKTQAVERFQLHLPVNGKLVPPTRLP